MRAVWSLNWVAACVVLQIAFSAATSNAQLPFFPGAEGFGGSFTGTAPAGGWFSNASLYHVTNLNDGGPGSFRNAFVQNTANRIIVFDVAGTIQLTGPALDIKNLSNYYVAGQTAPGPVTIYGNTTQITHSNDRVNSNVILRYLTFRKGAGNGEDAITFSGGDGAGDTTATNMILDHVSASWAEDEILSVANNNTNVTVQYSIISDALVSDHAYGSLIRPRIDSNVTFHHNLYAHNSSRQAQLGTYNGETLTADFRNNVIYNWRDRASYAGGSSEAEQEYADINYVGNYLIAGPGTQSNSTRAFHVDRNVDARVYQAGNFIDSDRQLNPGGVPNGNNTGWNMFVVSSVVDQPLEQMATPFGTAPVTTQSAADAYRHVLGHVGNSWWSRDLVDTRVVNNVRSNTGPPIGAAAPIVGELSAVLGAPLIARPADWDSDNDAMPDAWETAHGLNPNSPTMTPDWKQDFDSDGYINLVEYLNDTGAFPAPAPIVFSGSLSNRYAEIANWKTDDGGITAGSHWQPSRFDRAQIASGTVVVDSVGQHAKSLQIGIKPGDQAQLQVAGGWLDVEEDVTIGGGGSQAMLTLSGGLLRTETLRKDDGGVFDFSGGVLQATSIQFGFTNGGGIIAPGQSVGSTQVTGDLVQADGSLQIEIANAALADSLVVEGSVTLGGALEVAAIGGFTPTIGDSWPIVMAANFGGQFASITDGYAVQRQGDHLLLNYVGLRAILPGDFNDDGVVDAADYVAWRTAVSHGGFLANETSTPGVADQQDYTAWRANFGATRPAFSSAMATAVSRPVVVNGPLSGATDDGSALGFVPEPATLLPLVLGTLTLVPLRLKRRQGRGLRSAASPSSSPSGGARIAFLPKWQRHNR